MVNKMALAIRSTGSLRLKIYVSPWKSPLAFNDLSFHPSFTAKATSVDVQFNLDETLPASKNWPDYLVCHLKVTNHDSAFLFTFLPFSLGK